MILAGVVGDAWLSVSPSVALSSPESCTDQGDHINYIAATHFAWDQAAGITIQCSPNGSTGWATVTDYTFQWPIGRVVFNTARVVGTNNYVRIQAGNYFAVTQIANAHAWSLSLKVDTKDSTSFQAAGNWATNVAIINHATGTIDIYMADDRILQEVNRGAFLVIQLYQSYSAGARFQFYAWSTGIDQTQNVTDIDKQKLSFVQTGPMYWINNNVITLI